ncbi:MAG: response regulator [Saprospiraceae bacterium]|nr:response regulator [Saprospiraceae bacterium]
MIKAMIVDDEQSSIELLQWLITNYCPDITQIKSARSVKDAISLIEAFQPEIVFLDIQMPRQSGFDLLTSIENWNFEVIFTTAYNEYAIQAIRFSAGLFTKTHR